MEKVTVAIVNDVDLVVAGLKAMLGPFHDRIQVVSTQTGPLVPVTADVALVDAFGHPDAGLRRVREVLALGTVEHVALYTWRISPEGAQSFIEAGAAGVLSKAASADQTARSIELLSDGKQVIDTFAASAFIPSWEDVGADLSTRDVEILALVAKGYDNAEIGGELYLAESTVKTYIKRLYQSLGVHTRAQAVMRAVEMGLTRHHPGA